MGGPQRLCGAEQLTQQARSKVAGRLPGHTCQHAHLKGVPARFLGARPEGLTGKRAEPSMENRSESLGTRLDGGDGGMRIRGMNLDTV